MSNIKNFTCGKRTRETVPDRPRGANQKLERGRRRQVPLRTLPPRQRSLICGGRREGRRRGISDKDGVRRRAQSYESQSGPTVLESAIAALPAHRPRVEWRQVRPDVFRTVGRRAHSGDDRRPEERVRSRRLNSCPSHDAGGRFFFGFDMCRAGTCCRWTCPPCPILRRVFRCALMCSNTNSYNSFRFICSRSGRSSGSRRWPSIAP